MSTEITPQPETRLEALTAQYDLAKAEVDKAGEALKAITDGIKHELRTAAPGETSILLTSDLLARPLLLAQIESWRVDAKKLKAEDPLTYVRFATKSFSWSMRPVSS